MNKLRLNYLTSNSYATFSTKHLADKMKHVGDTMEKLSVLHGADSTLIECTGDLITLKGEENHVPAFIHPYYYKGKICLDARAYVNKEGNIKDLSEWQLLKKRGMMEIAWIEDRFDFNSQMDLVVDAFASWFSSGIAKRLNMDMVDAQTLKLYAAIYYMGLLNTSMEMPIDEVKIVLVRNLTRTLRVPVTLVEELLDSSDMEVIAKIYNFKGNEEPPAVNKIHMLISVFNKITDGLYKLELATIYASLTRGAFISANSPELTAVAIEFPPMFFLMVSYAMDKGIHGKTTIGIAVNSIVRVHDGDKFRKFITGILTPSS